MVSIHLTYDVTVILPSFYSCPSQPRFLPSECRRVSFFPPPHALRRQSPQGFRVPQLSGLLLGLLASLCRPSEPLRSWASRLLGGPRRQVGRMQKSKAARRRKARQLNVHIRRRRKGTGRRQRRLPLKRLARVRRRTAFFLFTTKLFSMLAM